MRKPLFLLLLSALLIGSCTPRDAYIAVSGYAQGGTYTVKLNLSGVSASEDQISAGIDSILTLVDETLSGYNKSSILSRRNAGEGVPTNAVFEDILARSEAFRAETGGAFDAGAAPLFDIWGFGFTDGEAPSDELVRQTLERRGEQWNFNAIAQGYTCDLIAGYLHSLGVKDMLVDIGEIFCEGLNPSRKPWTIGIDSPIDGNETPGAQLQAIHRCGTQPQGIVTSGNYRKFYLLDGRKVAHTIDPRTGYPVTHSLLSATLVAPTATAADAYATYCMVIGLEEARAFIEGRPDLEGYLIYDEDGAMKAWASAGFDVTSY